MGRDAVATCHWQDVIAETRLHLDAQYLSLRGKIRADLPRADLVNITLIPEGLHLSSPDGPLLIELGEKDARAWQKALLKPPPTLAEKLGISPEHPGHVTGEPDDQTLARALAGNTTKTPEQAAVLVHILRTPEDLHKAIAAALGHPDRHLWCIYGKGKVDVGATLVRTTARAAGLIDSKSCGVSETLTATRYRMRTG